ncbi:MAG TPA: pyridoxamine 5'-phosphate oxidase family protein [Aliidongia sp.]|nr:pyridoxamine 5'-phosphate oxidase family protein [Aliidongia sp.]
MTGHTASDIAFTPAVKGVQARRGSREQYRRYEEHGGWRTDIDEDLEAFLAEIDTAYLATVSSDGQPYAQHRGGPRGFIRVLGPRTLGFVDYRGNRQYITTGNLAGNDKAFLFLMDYAQRRRVKIWGRARVVEGDEDLIRQLMPEGSRVRPEQVILFEVEAWDVNCPQHIPRKIDAADVEAAIGQLTQRVRELEVALAAARAGA